MKGRSKPKRAKARKQSRPKGSAKKASSRARHAGKAGKAARRSARAKPRGMAKAKKARSRAKVQATSSLVSEPLEQVTVTCSNCGRQFTVVKLPGLSLEGMICQRCELGEIEFPEN